MPHVADKTNGIKIILLLLLLLLLLSSPFYIRPSDGNGMTKVPCNKTLTPCLRLGAHNSCVHNVLNRLHIIKLQRNFRKMQNYYGQAIIQESIRYT